jgi:hypothetical protein
LRIKIDDDGMTQAVSGEANAKVAKTVSPADLLKMFSDRLRHPVLSASDISPHAMVDVRGAAEFYVRGNRIAADDLASLFAEGKRAGVPFKSVTFAVDPSFFGDWRPRAQRAIASLELGEPKATLSLPVKLPEGELGARGGFPARVHVAENYQTNIERRWWLAGKLETDDIPNGSSRACRAVLTNDFDERQGDKYAIYKAVIFNPVPGPPMGKATRLSFRYHLTGTDSLRLQIYTLSKGYHRQLNVKGLEQGRWAEATVDMTHARRPDGSGGPLSEDERIDDIQFYTHPAAELLIDDIVLYDAADKPPLTWKAAKAVAAPDGESHWIRIDLRGDRPVPPDARLRFRYSVGGEKPRESLSLGIELGMSGNDRRGGTSVKVTGGAWRSADVDLSPAIRELRSRHKTEGKALTVRDLVFRVPKEVELLVDDVLLYEPGVETKPKK